MGSKVFPDEKIGIVFVNPGFFSARRKEGDKVGSALANAKEFAI
jgi:hypothetical protein